MSHLRRVFAVVALALVVFPLAASAPLFDPDEGLHAAIAQEMVQHGDYVTPTFRSEPFLDKPILFFWAEAASLRMFGDHAAAVRLPPLLFGLFGMIAIAMLGRALFDEATGLLAGLAYGTMLLPMGVSEVAVHDIGLVPFMALAALWLVRAEAGANAWKSGIAAGIALGLSILTKGLVGVVFAGILGLCLTVRRPAAWLRLGVVLSLALVVAVLVAAPWYVAMEHAHPGYLYYYFVERHLQGYLTATQRHSGRPIWYYLPIVLGGALPWTAYLVGAARSVTAGPARHDPANSIRLVLWGWFGIGLVFLSAGESKLVTYALPLFPILALIIGDYVARTLSLNPRDRAFRAAVAVHAAALAILPALGLLIVKIKFGEVRPALWAGALLAALAVAAAARQATRQAPSAFATGLAAMTVIATFGLTVLVAPRVAAWMTSRDLAAALNAAGALPERVSVLDERIGSLIFYLDPALRAQATPERVGVVSFPESVLRARTDAPGTLYAVRNNQLARFNRLFPTPPAPDRSAGTFSLYRADTLRSAAAR